MLQQRIAPTRSNLLRTRHALDLTREGFEILDRKREVLTNELIHVAHDAAALQDQVWHLLDEAYEALKIARLSTGREHLEWAALSLQSGIRAEVIPHSVMGVVLPSVRIVNIPAQVPYGLGDTTVPMDETVVCFRRVLEEIPLLAEMMTTVWRLALELQKTQRRVNALQYIFIPQYEETVKFIENALEEREREEIFRLKRIKSRASQLTVGPTTRQYQQPSRDVSGTTPTIYRDIGGGRSTSREFG